MRTGQEQRQADHGYDAAELHRDHGGQQAARAVGRARQLDASAGRDRAGGVRHRL